MAETAADSPQTRHTGGGGTARRQGVVSNGKGGKFVSGGKLTEKQAAFVRLYVANGGNKRHAVEQAGYDHGYPMQEASRLLRNEHIQEALRQERAQYIATDLAGVALTTMLDLMRDDSTPASTRFQAAKWSLETAGHGQQAQKHGLPDPDKPLSSMSLSELETFISAGRDALERPTIEGKAQRIEDIEDVELDEAADSDSAQDSAQIEDMMRVSD